MTGANALADLALSPAVSTIVCLGTGGVGKTTTAAALGAYAAGHGRAALVVTVDPAARLAQIMGQPQQSGLIEQPSTPWQPHAVAQAPGLSMVHLDASAVFDAAVREALPAQQAQSLLANRYYRLVADAFAGSADYMAAELVGRLRERVERTGELLIVDTAPAVSAFEVLDAPARLAAFTDSRFVRTLRGIGSGERGSGLTRRLIGAVLGSDLTSEVAELLTSLHAALIGMRDRAHDTLAHLTSQSSAFVLVTRPAAGQVQPVREAAANLRARGYRIAVCAVNQTPPLDLRFGISDDLVRESVRALEARGDSESLSVSDALRLLLEEHRVDAVADSLADELIEASGAAGVRLPRSVAMNQPAALAALIASAW